MLVLRPMRPPRGKPPCDTLRPIRLLTNVPLPPSLPLRSRARRNKSDVLGRRLSAAAVPTGFLSMMSDVDERRKLGGVLMLKYGDGVLLDERE